jgi:hypothetical protein
MYKLVQSLIPLLNQKSLNKKLSILYGFEEHVITCPMLQPNPIIGVFIRYNIRTRGDWFKVHISIAQGWS